MLAGHGQEMGCCWGCCLDRDRGGGRLRRRRLGEEEEGGGWMGWAKCLSCGREVVAVRAATGTRGSMSGRRCDGRQVQSSREAPLGGGRKGVGALILAVPGPGARGWVENGADGEGGTGWLFCRLDPNFASPASPRPLPEDPTLPPAPAPAPALSNELRGWKPPPRLPRPPSTLGPSLFLFFAYRHAARHVPLPLHFPHLIRPAAIPTRGDEAGPKDKTGSVMGGKTCNAWPPRNIYHKGRIRRADSCRLVQRDASQLRGG